MEHNCNCNDYSKKGANRVAARGLSSLLEQAKVSHCFRRIILKTAVCCGCPALQRKLINGLINFWKMNKARVFWVWCVWQHVELRWLSPQRSSCGNVDGVNLLLSFFFFYYCFFLLVMDTFLSCVIVSTIPDYFISSLYSTMKKWNGIFAFTLILFSSHYDL